MDMPETKILLGAAFIAIMLTMFIYVMVKEVQSKKDKQ